MACVFCSYLLVLHFSVMQMQRGRYHPVRQRLQKAAMPAVRQTSNKQYLYIVAKESIDDSVLVVDWITCRCSMAALAQTPFWPPPAL